MGRNQRRNRTVVCVGKAQESKSGESLPICTTNRIRTTASTSVVNGERMERPAAYQNDR